MLCPETCNVSLVMYGRLAVTEENEMHKKFGAMYETYVQKTPRFIPSLLSKPGDETRG